MLFGFMEKFARTEKGILGSDGEIVCKSRWTGGDILAKRNKRVAAQQMRQEVRQDILGLSLLAAGGLLYFFLRGGGGLLEGAVQFLLRGGMGQGAVILPALLILGGLVVLAGRGAVFTRQRLVGLMLGVAALLTALSAMRFPFKEELAALHPLAAAQYSGGGVVGSLLAYALDRLVGPEGRWLVLAFALAVAAVLLTQKSLGQGWGLLARRLSSWGRAVVDFVYTPEREEPPPRGSARETPEARSPSEAPPPPEPAAVRPRSAKEGGTRSAKPLLPQVPGPYRPPPLELLSSSPGGERRSLRDQADKARILQDTLESFGVRVKILGVTEGPTVTRFELQPPPGVKVSRIISLADDIALAMAAPDVRVEAPIPGKAAVGIEVPNREISPVLLREVLESVEYAGSESALTVALGKDIAGRTVVAQLEHMPHLLIAGATGSGKSVCLNNIIVSLLYRAGPAQVRLLLIDPKMVELNIYNGLPHLWAPVITDPKKAARVLRHVAREMERRYEAFAAAGVRDIGKYNAGAPEGGPLPYIVVVIDELGDLMNVAPVEVEDTVCRLAQMARAAGIHLVLATQRPSVDVVTGVIKANIPSRIAFAVSSQVDSRTILDMPGADKLVGKGDMLFLPMGASKPIRVQGAYVSEREVEEVVAAVLGGAEPEYDQEVLAAVDAEEVGEEEAVDELFAQAVRVVMEARQASASLLQRRMRVGYSRAARLVDTMERRGIVGPAEGSRPREVFLTWEQYRNVFGGE